MSSRELHVAAALSVNGQHGLYSTEVQAALAEKNEKSTRFSGREFLLKLDTGEIVYPASSVFSVQHDALLVPPPILLPSRRREYLSFTERRDGFAFYGQERAKEQTVRYLNDAAAKGRSDRMLVFVGRSGTGKSTLEQGFAVSYLRRVATSNKDYTQAPMYAIEGCPINEDPIRLILHFLPPERQDTLRKELRVHGELCPHCRKTVSAIAFGEGDSSDWEKVLDNIKIVSLNTDSMAAVTKLNSGMINNPDERETLERAMLASGRGILIIPELYDKMPFLLAQKDFIRDGRLLVSGGSGYSGGEYDIQTLVMGSMTYDEWKLFNERKDIDTTPILARMEVVYLPFLFSRKAEARIYREVVDNLKTFQHVGDATLFVFADYGVRTRLKTNVTNAVSQMTPDFRMDFADGKKVDGFEEVMWEVLDKKSIAEQEGMDTGVAPQWMSNRLSEIIANNPDRDCIDPIFAVKELRKYVEQEAQGGYSTTFAEKSRYKTTILPETERRVNQLVAQAIIRAWQGEGYEERVYTTIQEYIDNAGKYLEMGQGKSRSPFWDEDKSMDRYPEAEKKMTEIEVKGNGKEYNETQKQNYRTDAFNNGPLPEGIIDTSGKKRETPKWLQTGVELTLGKSTTELLLLFQRLHEQQRATDVVSDPVKDAIIAEARVSGLPIDEIQKKLNIRTLDAEQTRSILSIYTFLLKESIDGMESLCIHCANAYVVHAIANRDIFTK